MCHDSFSVNAAMHSFDSYIFDMDGTLWDAVDSYCAIWNRTAADCGVAAPTVTRTRLEELMGLHLDYICTALMGPGTATGDFMKRLDVNERAMMPVLGGRLYPGVRATLEALLAGGSRLFMVSNCQADGLPTFVRFCGFEGFFTELLSFGSTRKEKEINIKEIVERYKLESPLYVGDTEGDCRSAHAAGVPFAWAAYGFGRDVPDCDYRLDKIEDILSCVPRKKQIPR